MRPINKHRKQGKSLSQVFSKTSNANDDRQQQKINELEEEIRRLKTTQNITTETTNITQTKINNLPQQNSKNGNAAFATTETSKKTSTYSK